MEGSIINNPKEDRVIDGITKHKIIKIVLIVVIALSVIANGVQGYIIFRKYKAYHALEVILNDKSNCPECPVPTICPTLTPPVTATPTTSKSNSSSTKSNTQETVISPPPPPAD